MAGYSESEIRKVESNLELVKMMKSMLYGMDENSNTYKECFTIYEQSLVEVLQQIREMKNNVEKQLQCL